jgi:hypothetical protein
MPFNGHGTDHLPVAAVTGVRSDSHCCIMQLSLQLLLRMLLLLSLLLPLLLLLLLLPPPAPAQRLVLLPVADLAVSAAVAHRLVSC